VQHLGQALRVQGQQLRPQVDPAADQGAQAGCRQEGNDLPARIRVAQRVPGGVQIRLQSYRQCGEARELVARGEDARAILNC
jgi:hypothetical protein